LRVALIEFALFDAIYEMLDLVRISGGNVIVVFHRRRSRRSYARQKRTPRPEHKYFLFSRGLTAGTLWVSASALAFSATGERFGVAEVVARAKLPGQRLGPAAGAGLFTAV
jgi:hypothetical protein